MPTGAASTSLLFRMGISTAKYGGGGEAPGDTGGLRDINARALFRMHACFSECAVTHSCKLPRPEGRGVVTHHFVLSTQLRPGLLLRSVASVPFSERRSKPVIA